MPISSRSLSGLTVGRNAHFVHETGTHCAAIIVALGTDLALGECELAVFVPQFGLSMREHVFFQPDLKSPGTWHWIEFAE